MVWDRKHVEFIHQDRVAWQPLSTVGQGLHPGTDVRVLSFDPGDGASTCIWKIPAGWRHDQSYVTEAPQQLFVLSGELYQGGHHYTEGFYSYHPAGAAHGPLWTDQGCTVLAMWDKAFNVTPDPGSTEGIIGPLDTINMHWQPTIAEGPQAGIMVKVLRVEDQTGGMTFITGIMPHWRENRREHHDCVEESFKLTGDMNLNTDLNDQLLMTENCYFYRPPYRKHGPLYTRQGTMSLIRISSKLVNHYGPLPEQEPELAATL